METSRREFLGRVATSTAMLGMLPLAREAAGAGLDLRELDPLRTGAAAPDWDLSWVSRITGKYRAVFDVPEIDSGYGVWRASIWVNQYADVLKASPKQMSPVLVLRHNGINLALQDVVDTIKKHDNLSDEDARKRALGYLVPGVILQPSGVFAALRAQDAGCRYLRAS